MAESKYFESSWWYTDTSKRCSRLFFYFYNITFALKVSSCSENARLVGSAVLKTGCTFVGANIDFNNSSSDRLNLLRLFSSPVRVTVDTTLLNSPGFLPDTKIVTRLVWGAERSCVWKLSSLTVCCKLPPRLSWDRSCWFKACCYFCSRKMH